jgi:hypothetical protein
MMDDLHRRALSAVRFNWAPTSDDVWRPNPSHVIGLNRGATELILDGVDEARESLDASPLGVALVGQRGTGKTHLLGVIRQQVQQDGGYFFLISLLDASAFWRSGVLSMLDGLTREPADARSQLLMFLHRLADYIEAPRSVRRAATGDVPLSRAALDAFIDQLRKKERQLGTDCQDTARALVLRASADVQTQDVGHTFLSANDEEEPGERAAWGIRRSKRSAQEIVRDISRLLALTGPAVVAVDQIDLLVNQSWMSTMGISDERRESLLLEQIAGGLMALREMTRRTLSVVSVLPATWSLIQTRATDTVQDRFRQSRELGQINAPDIARELVEQRFAVAYAKVGFSPPYPSWPVAHAAFDEGAGDFTPRALLITIDNHVRGCLRDDEVRELHHLVQTTRHTPNPVIDVATGTLAGIDARFSELRNRAEAEPALNSDTEDDFVPGLVAAGLTAWIAEQGDGSGLYSQDPPPGAKPALHARLLRSLDEDHEDQAHWAFRAIAASNAIASLNRIRNAMTASALTEGVSKRKLFLLRNDDWSPGPKTAEVVAAFEEAGGRRLAFPASDIRTLVALRDLFASEDTEVMRAWCAARRPTRDVSFLQAALDEPPPLPREPTMPRPTVSGPAVVLGSTMDGGRPVPVPLEELRKHMAIFAGSGSGKTVLIRRLVEECALQGVSAIVLDPNNDLARLGDPWPEAPSTWDSDDAVRAKEYLDHTDVVVWTPRREAGRPLTFQPLPDFAGVIDDQDEFAASVDAGVAALIPRANVDGNTNRHRLGQAVLREALMSFGRRGGASLRDFIALLADLPAGISVLNNAAKIAGDMSQTLAAAMVNDPLFGGAGEPMDPGVLLTPPAGKRARVSVISFVGLPADEQRQSFVNQLQLALFSWIKQHPAGNRPLGGLLVMDEAQTLAPSGAMTPCTQSTLALVSQARKYGLGLVFATQAPKGLHNFIPGNASTQLFGRLNSPVQIAAAKDIARAKGSDVPEIARLGTGQFYAAVAGGAFEQLQAPLCLSYHPKSPLTTEEVVERARRITG